MKAFHILSSMAVPAICLSLSSCSRDYEGYLQAATDASHDAAEILDACQNVEDADDAADDLLDLAEKLEAMKKDFLCDYIDAIRGAVFDPDLEEPVRIQAYLIVAQKHKEIQNSYRELNPQWTSAVSRIRESDGLRQHKYLDFKVLL